MENMTNIPIRVDRGFEREFPGASALATEACANLVHTASTLLDELNRHRASVTDLSPTAAQALAVLDGAGEALPSSVIASRLLVTTASMTSLLDTLERRGFVERRSHPGDRRKILVELTPSGSAVVEKMLPVIHGAQRRAMEGLDQDQRETLVDLLALVQMHLEDIRGQELPRPRPRRRRARR